jgi:phosphatidate cytidylyltransferase
MAVATLVLFVKIGDTGAYTTGRLFGKHKMTPTLSPGKTWEGAFGAITWAALAAVAVWYFWVPKLDATDQHFLNDSFWSSAKLGGCLRWIAFGVIMAICGMLGDLAESLIKRDLGRKDSSSWVPGFGGVLDILDSILFVGPVAYLCWLMNLIA